MGIIKQFVKSTGTTYVYDSESYWDPVKKQSRSRRKLIGKLDPETGEVVPTGKKGRKPKNESLKLGISDEQTLAYQKQLDQAQTSIKKLHLEIADKNMTIEKEQRENQKLKSELKKVKKSLVHFIDVIDEILEDPSEASTQELSQPGQFNNPD